MQYPDYRGRRLRRRDGLRRLVRETQLAVDDLVYPMFAVDGKNQRRPIPSLPGQFHLSVDELTRSAEEAFKLGVPAVLLFGVTEKKDAVGSEAWNDEGAVQRAIRALRRALPELIVIADACFCEYTSHGHCGILNEAREVDNDATLENLGRLALSYARAGVDIVAPSGMMDGTVGYLREELDEGEHQDVAILSYSAKYASAFYGPFRDAAGSTPQQGDRKGYQMDPANGDEAIREMSLDVQEGADCLMVKPALAYLDVLRRAREEFDLPIAAYNVSGEYVMLKAAAEKGWIDYDRAMLETLTSIKRAGADFILTYHAVEAAKLLAGVR